MKKQITIDGVTYESIKDFCDSTDTHISCLRQYAKYHNISFEEACSAYKNGVVNKRTQCEFEINGKQFNSFSGACRYYGFYVAKVLRYASANNIDKIEALRVFVKHYNRPNGYSKNETTKEGRIRVNFITINNVQYVSILDACKKLGVSYSAVMYYKKYYNVSIEDAINYYLNNDLKDYSIVYKDKTYKSIKEVCETFNLKYNTIMQYKKRKKCSTEQMLDYFINKSNNATK